jgi:hypothetical protein
MIERKDDLLAEIRQLGYGARIVDGRIIVKLNSQVSVNVRETQLRGLIDQLKKKGNQGRANESTPARSRKAFSKLAKRAARIRARAVKQIVTSAPASARSLETQTGSRPVLRRAFATGQPCPGGLPSLGKHR